ncbi:glycoside hydrolase family 127 protein [Pedobacter jejuensis]|uniref:Glycoside hydrolase family 127 protein n=1 Tax=Pedobacter jejuensis TaxID=1268550 RepID=A0A3N0C130_9SPHI|nr:glycoside hydrolase family 127 protein [Pedobacter jejuensis]RNL55736.1 glycoside hydrolase family 127 protein [Pedobacter jejuensis]
MRYTIFVFLLLTKFTFAQNLHDYKINPIQFNKVKLNDKFWLPRIETNKNVTIPTSFARCETTGRIKNFEMAAAKKGKFCTAYVFDDTDIYKTIEGASYSLAVYPDAKLDAYLDSLINVVSKAQEPDGYLYTARTIDPANPPSWSGKDRWINESNMSHELYNSGHLIEAAVAHYQSTGKKNLLNIAIKNANLLVATFGDNKQSVAPGHEIVEMALVRLYRATSNESYLKLAKFFIDQRGKKKYDFQDNNPWKNGKYWQDNEPVINQDEAVGHAVRAMYLYAGMADVAALTGDPAYIKAIDRIWENMTSKKMYVQGGIGAVPDGERFGNNYDLPNATAYNETCAAIGNVYWNQRMFLLHGDSKYIDVMEKVLYNALLSGVGLDGKSFFYTNAMQIINRVTHKDAEPARSGWFECSCCPTNMARFLPSLPGYIYAQLNNQIYINLFVASSTELEVNNEKVKISQNNNYPWDGNLSISVDPVIATQFSLNLRLPGWVREEAIPSDLYKFKTDKKQAFQVSVNGKKANYRMEKGYVIIDRKWQKGDKVEFILPMQVKKIIANEQLVDDKGKISLQRGPLMFCGESIDNDGVIASIKIPSNAKFTANFSPDILNGIIKLKTPAINSLSSVAQKNVELTVIPYYAWANRGKGEMSVWFAEAK